MRERQRRQAEEFADIVPGQTTEVYLDAGDRQSEALRADARQPALVMLQGDLPGCVFRLHTGRQLIGRRSDCEIRLREKAISGHHAEIVRTDAGVSVADLRSTNGTVVNGRRIRDAVFLAQGNLLKLGQSVFKFVDSLVEVELSESLYVRSTIDEVTGLPNRAAFATRLGFLIDTASPARPLSVIVFDLDDFTMVLGSRGRAGADDALRAAAKCLRDVFAGEMNALCRLGDESFAVAVSGAPLATAAAAASAARGTLESYRLRPSIGVVATDSAKESAEAMIARAEEMSARARREGGNRVSLG